MDTPNQGKTKHCGIERRLYSSVTKGLKTTPWLEPMCTGNITYLLVETCVGFMWPASVWGSLFFTPFVVKIWKWALNGLEPAPTIAVTLAVAILFVFPPPPHAPSPIPTPWLVFPFLPLSPLSYSIVSAPSVPSVPSAPSIPFAVSAVSPLAPSASPLLSVSCSPSIRSTLAIPPLGALGAI